ncbi:ABC transporter substrate-binding protein [Salipiger pallidus]|uniref:ABC transporter substrate-binding protein n=1 Tax=Salipiger pallidus TaxID=1775170 RepID=A0A8J2ZIG1_9RHOB|nr:acyclic terpene utilization AtuA family protein [Salipiger pallidus]GGG66590.1 ABC transporter substrate-binding protein [Salipiger pallidus]
MTIRIGAGAGFAGDRIEPAIDLAERGDLDFLVFECLAERTIALAQQAKLADPASGYDRMLERRMRAVLAPCRRGGTRIVTNMGAANPRAAAEAVRTIARELGLTDLKVAAVTGDDVLDRVAGLHLIETNCTAGALGDKLVSANAYIGVGAIVGALDAGADVVICGRASDPSLFLAPLVHSFGWAMDDWTRLGRGTLVGHLLECAAQITGGYFADPGHKDVPDLAHVGFPLAEVEADGNAILTKLEGTGGAVTRATCTEQLLYEIHDPSAYIQPDVVADFSHVTFEEIGPDRIAVRGGDGRAPTGKLKVSVGYRDGWIGEGQISYAGPGCIARGRLAIDIVRDRLRARGAEIHEQRGELIGYNSVGSEPDPAIPEPPEIRMRYAARCTSQEVASSIAEEVEGLYLCGPSGGGGATGHVREVVGVASGLIPTDDSMPVYEIFEA